MRPCLGGYECKEQGLEIQCRAMVRPLGPWAPAPFSPVILPLHQAFSPQFSGLLPPLVALSLALLAWSEIENGLTAASCPSRAFCKKGPKG